ARTARGQPEGARRQTLGRGTRPARRGDEADVRLPPEHTAVVFVPPQRRYLSERRPRAAVAFRGGKGRQDLLTLSARARRPTGARATRRRRRARGRAPPARAGDSM